MYFLTALICTVITGAAISKRMRIKLLDFHTIYSSNNQC